MRTPDSWAKLAAAGRNGHGGPRPDGDGAPGAPRRIDTARIVIDPGIGFGKEQN
jgi:hypothetical protein